MVMQSMFPPGRQQLINYDWIDIASATGYIVFDAFREIHNTGSSYHLIDTAYATALLASIPSAGNDNTLQSTITGAAGQDLDLDLDLGIFQLPRTIEGDVFVRISVAAGAAKTAQYFIIKLRKWDATAGESEIASRQSGSANIGAAGERTVTMKITAPKTHFKKGNILRLTIESFSTDANNYYLAHNPNDTSHSADFTAGNTRLTLAVPFKLDFM